MNDHHALSQSIEILGFVMQAAILAMLLWRRLGRKFPAFSLMLIFFLLRAAFSYGVTKYATHLKSVTPVQWNRVVVGFNIAEDALQVAILIELILWLVPVLKAWRLKIWWQLAVGALAAIGVVWVALDKLGYWNMRLTVGRDVPLQTLVLMNSHIGLIAAVSLLLILAAVAAVALSQPDAPDTAAAPVQLLATKFALGWGVFGSVNLIGLAVGHYAMKAGNGPLWEKMQLIVIGAYVLMMLLWLVSLIGYRGNKAAVVAAGV